MFDFWKLFRTRRGPQHYVPGQPEPEEYNDRVVELIALHRQGKLGGCVLIVGFDDYDKTSAICQTSKQLGFRCSSIKHGPSFKRRNPVIELKYDQGANLEAIIQDARRLKEGGATDLSAVGITEEAAQKLIDIFGKMSCPALAFDV